MMTLFKKLQTKESLMGAGSLFLIVASIAVVLAVLLSVVAFKNFKENPNPYQNTISVTGNGEVTAVPDIATVSFSVHSEGKDIAAAQKIVTESANAVIKALKDGGIDEKDIKTDSYTSNPKYEWSSTPCREGFCPPGNQKLVGYEVTHSMTVKIRNLDKVGDILAVLGTQKVENMYGPNFTFDDDRDLQSEARAKAIDDAKTKAKELAKSLGVHLGKIVEFSDSGYGGPVPYMLKGGVAMDAATAESAPAPTVPTGENTVSSQVTITFRIK